MLTWLAAAAIADWLITRTLTRAGVFMPKIASVQAGFEVLGFLGQVALATSALLGMGIIGWLSWRRLIGGRPLFAIAIFALLILNVVSLFDAPAGWTAVSYHLLALTAIGSVGLEVMRQSVSTEHKVIWIIPAAAMFVGELYLATNAVEVALQSEGRAALGGLLFSFGELLVVISGFALWWRYRREPLPWTAKVVPLAAAATFAALYFLQPSMLGVFSIWSVGLTLYLPWPIYALSLYAIATAAFAALRMRWTDGLAILMLMAAGFAPQLSHQFTTGLIGLLLLGQAAPELAATKASDLLNAPQAPELSLEA
jgi:hypothetical protein